MEYSLKKVSNPPFVNESVGVSFVAWSLVNSIKLSLGFAIPMCHINNLNLLDVGVRKNSNSSTLEIVTVSLLIRL